MKGGTRISGPRGRRRQRIVPAREVVENAYAKLGALKASKHFKCGTSTFFRWLDLYEIPRQRPRTPASPRAK